MSLENVSNTTGTTKSEKLERFAELLDLERFFEAREVAEQFKAEGDGLAQPLINYRGHEVVSRYLHADPEKAKRIAEAFGDWKWNYWLR